MKTEKINLSSAKKLIVIQEVFPVYREKLFDEINSRVEFQLLVSSDKLGDINVSSKKEYIKCVGEIRGLFNKKVYWQHGILNYKFNKNDVVVLPASPRNLAVILLLFKLKLKGIKTVLWGHYESATGTKLGYILRMLLIRFSSAVLFYTDLEVERYKKTKWGRNDFRQIIGLNNGSDYEEIKKFVIPYKLNYSDRVGNILFIGRLTEKTKLSYLLKAVHLIGHKQKITIHVIGNGVLKEKIIEEALNLGVNLVWHGTLTAEKEISKIANICSLFVYPGSVGLSLIHSMSYGLPCLVHNNRANQNPEIDALLDKTENIFFEENNILDLSNKISYLLSNDNYLKEDSFRNVGIIETKYNIKSMSSKFIFVFDNIG